MFKGKWKSIIGSWRKKSLLGNSRKFSNTVLTVTWKVENGYNELQEFEGVFWLFLAAYSKIDRTKCCGMKVCIPQDSSVHAERDGTRRWGLWEALRS